MNIGVTGTQHGMTIPQHDAIMRWFHEFDLATPGEPLEKIRLGHGDCIGADAQFHFMAFHLCWPVDIFPPDDDSKRAWCLDDGFGRLIMHDPAPYLVRDKAIVDWCNVLVAAPKTAKEVIRSGTWATIRYARKMNKPIFIFWPDGTHTAEETV